MGLSTQAETQALKGILIALIVFYSIHGLRFLVHRAGQ